MNKSDTFTGSPMEIIAYVSNEATQNPDRMYDLTVHKEKRSGQANRYFHRLCNLLAKGEKARFFAKKNELILQYGNHELERDEAGDLKYTLLKDNDEWKSDPVYHYYPTNYTDTFRGVQMRAFVYFKGTSTYNSADMAHLIDCTRDECLGCGIPIEEVETFEEKRFMEELRAKSEEQKNESL